jgi:hypothetical protein
MNKQSLLTFLSFSALYIIIGLFLLDGGLVLISVVITSLYIAVSSILALLNTNKKLSNFWIGFLISVICLFSSPLVLVSLLRYYALCR